MKVKRLTAVILSLVLIISLAVPAFAAKDFKPYENSSYYTIGDYDLHYRIQPAKGERQGRILMIHGFLCSTYAWRNMADILCENGYECVTVDVPNFGYSTRENKNMTVIPREELIISLMESIAPAEEWIIAGHSMGGGIAINIAEKIPVKALMLYSPCPQEEFPPFAEKICTSGPMEKFMTFFFNVGTRCKPLVKLVIYAATFDWQFAMNYDVSGVTNAVQYDGFGAGLCEMMYNVLPTDMEKANEINCPVLLCQAEKDIILSDKQKSAVNNAFPDAVTHLVKGGGHQCIENRADELCAVTLDFIKGKIK